MVSVELPREINALFRMSTILSYSDAYRMGESTNTRVLDTRMQLG